MLKSEQTGKAFDACTPFLAIVEQAIVETEANLARLNAIRRIVKRELLGENLIGGAAYVLRLTGNRGLCLLGVGTVSRINLAYCIRKLYNR